MKAEDFAKIGELFENWRALCLKTGEERNRAIAERDESRREHLITQEQLALVTKRRDELEHFYRELEGFANAG